MMLHMLHNTLYCCITPGTAIAVASLPALGHLIYMYQYTYMDIYIPAIGCLTSGQNIHMMSPHRTCQEAAAHEWHCGWLADACSRKMHLWFTDPSLLIGLQTCSQATASLLAEQVLRHMQHDTMINTNTYNSRAHAS